MDHIKVKSSNIESIGFENGTMQVKFKNGGLYEYQCVTLEQFNELKHSHSPGKHLNSMNMKGFKIVKVEEK